MKLDMHMSSQTTGHRRYWPFYHLNIQFTVLINSGACIEKSALVTKSHNTITRLGSLSLLCVLILLSSKQCAAVVYVRQCYSMSADWQPDRVRNSSLSLTNYADTTTAACCSTAFPFYHCNWRNKNQRTINNNVNPIPGGAENKRFFS